MNKQEFISLIEHPETLGKKNTTALKNIAADFPYFQHAQLLLTKALYNDKHYEFEKQLKYTAVMVPDRAVLFNYIYHPIDTFTISVVDETKETTNEVDTIIAELELPIIAHTIVEPSITIEPIAEVIEIIETPTEQHAETLEIESLETISTIDIIEQPAIIEEEVGDLENTVEKTEPNTPIATNNEEHSFTEWLKAIANGTQPITEDTVILEEVESTPALVPEVPPASTPPSNVPEFESVLDKFIRENPRMSRPKAEFYNPVNMAKQSVEENDEFITETLANVYYKQGHSKKAIKAYEKLCLIYPHKMSYFAGLIQKIKTENKD